ncbi:hypothetical protein HHK36_001634 [Tetracentron sinense]|uniref:Protodermal factor 1 n=1 Tax=Tetracentron sinense TaxID=13715 RepID=A0A835DV72_TETSI|nr:hypothetical protein HHK36_001634 [Tetracentron sinense]
MEMEKSTQYASWLILVLAAGLLSQHTLAIPVMSTSFEDQKTYYTPDPHPGTTPGGNSLSLSLSLYCSHKSPPSHGSSSGYGSRTPSHGSSGGHGTPSHGSSGSYNPTPSTGSGGGGYYHSPPSSTPVITTPPFTPIIEPGTPNTPTVDPGTPNIPYISTPSTPLLPDPNAPPFFIGTCDYWRTHSNAIWALLGWWGTVGGAFGVAATPAFGTNLSLLQALSNTRTDGIGALYREGTASLLNSMINKKFPFTTKQVKDGFSVALVSTKAAAAQAELFKSANEGRLKPRA